MGSLRNIDKIKAVVLDIDGVLTDGRIGYGADSNEIKFFHVRDGLRIALALRAGLKVGILSGRQSAANRTRARELKLSFMVEGCLNKLDGWEQLLRQENLQPEECMYVGDDLIDLPPLRRCGLAVAVGDASPEVKSAADFITPHSGGQGAVGDALEFLLKGQKRWDELLQRYYA